MAAMGEMRDARSAGISAATTVTTTPTISELSTAAVGTPTGASSRPLVMEVKR
jgi:hypothetical protein